MYKDQCIKNTLQAIMLTVVVAANMRLALIFLGHVHFTIIILVVYMVCLYFFKGFMFKTGEKKIGFSLQLFQMNFILVPSSPTDGYDL